MHAFMGWNDVKSPDGHVPDRGQPNTSKFLHILLAMENKNIYIMQMIKKSYASTNFYRLTLSTNMLIEMMKSCKILRASD
jgi:hypothetical protein